MGERTVSSHWSVLFFQAEDGIRDLVRSRGLGDVYKRQNLGLLQDVARPALVADLEQDTARHHVRQVKTQRLLSLIHI